MPTRLISAIVAAVVCGLTLVLLAPVHLPSASARAPSTSAYDGRCTGPDALSGVTVVIDYQDLDGNAGIPAPTEVRCSPATLDASGAVRPRSGLAALRDADVTVTGTRRWGDAFVCRIDARPGPTEPVAVTSNPGYREPCIDTPPASAYWSYWHADGSGQPWQYSQFGVSNRNVVPGGFEGWSFALNATADTNPTPRPDPVNEAVDPQAPQVTLASDVLDPPLTLGSAVRLQWSSRNAVSITAHGAWSGDLARPGGSRTVRPATVGTHRYEITATAADGSTADDVVVLEVTAGAEPAQPEEPVDAGPPTPGIDPAARRVSGWLIGELVGDAMPAPLPSASQPSDWGLSIDALWALHATGTGASAAAAMTRAIDRNAGDYLGVKLFGDASVRRGGQTAKLLLAAVVAGRDPRSFGRVMRADGRLGSGRYDLRRETEDLIATGGPQRGRLRDRGQGIDNTNVFSQALAVIGLARSGGVPRRAVDYLLRQQCSAGHFRMFDRSDRTCDADGDAPDTDGTAMGVQALMTAREHGTDGLDAAIGRGVAWLVSAQRSDGSYGGGVSTGGSNTNSTGLAAQTLHAAGELAAHRRAKAFVLTHLVDGQRATGALAGEVGAIAYDRDALDAARSRGISGRDQWRRATAQAVFALAPISFAHLGDDPPAGDPLIPPGPAGEEDGQGVPEEDGAPPAPPGTPTPPPGAAPAVAVAAPASPVAPSADPGEALARFLAAQLVGGDHIEVEDGGRTFVDYDTTADVVLALRLLGSQQPAARRATRFLLDDRSVAAYASGAAWETGGAAYAEPLAKLVMVASTSPREPDAATAAQLATRLTDLVSADGVVDRGRQADRSGSLPRLARVALAAAASGHQETADRVADLLADEQCADGGFPATTATDCSVGDPAVTGLVAQALNAGSAADADPDRAVDAAPSTWSSQRRVALAEAGALLQRTTAQTGTLVAPYDDSLVTTLAAVATGRAGVGLDQSRSALRLRDAVGPDGALPVRLPSTARPRTRPQASPGGDLDASIAAAPGVAGTSWLSAAGSPLQAQVQLPMRAEPEPDALPAAAPQVTAADSNPLPWIALALALGFLGFAIGRVTGRATTSNSTTPSESR